ncbi:MAG: hypothetical protein H6672_14890 [Anaerolineaceae bacterium]|nr:hypothetical protein [Anaerolineaceae bacterium]
MYAADFMVMGAHATLDIEDTYDFSLAFDNDAVRDQVFADLEEITILE